jgi:hypothetical protein
MYLKELPVIKKRKPKPAKIFVWELELEPEPLFRFTEQSRKKYGSAILPYPQQKTKKERKTIICLS